MEFLVTLLYVVGIIWSILNIILFFKIWGMTNDIKYIKESLRSTRSICVNEQKLSDSEESSTGTKPTIKNAPLNKIDIEVGDFVKNASTGEVMQIADINKDGTYKCINGNSHKLVGNFTLNQLSK